MLDELHQGWVFNDIQMNNRHQTDMYRETQEATAAPHVLMRPSLTRDGNMWCALYGENLMEGVAGFGETPRKACLDFDKNWTSQKAIAAFDQEEAG